MNGAERVSVDPVRREPRQGRSAPGWPAACDHRQRTSRQLVCEEAVHSGCLRRADCAGLPMLFMGQEFLEYRPFPNYNGYPDPIDWSRKDTYSGIWTLYRDMIRSAPDWYNNTRGLRGRNVHVLPVFGDNLLVYHRWDQGGRATMWWWCATSPTRRYANYQIGLPRPGIWRVRFNSDSRNYDGYFDNWPSFDTDANGPALNGMPYSADVSLGAYSCLVLSQD